MISIPTLTTDRLVLRAPAPKDHGPFAAFYGSDATQYVGGPMDAAQTWRYLCEVIGHWDMRGFGRWTVTARGDDTAIGLIGLHYPMDWPEAEIAWSLWSGNGKGYASEAGRAARAHAFNTLGWTTAISLISHGNDASERVAKAMGATLDGDHVHPTFGAMSVYRHQNPAEVAL